MKLLICFGTRPEFIKVKSLIDKIDGVKTLFTGQHVDLVKDLNFDYTVKIDGTNPNRLNDVLKSILKRNEIFENIDYVMVQGDTTSAMGMALSAFHHGIKVIHLEAGLRTGNILDPYPEELNRQIISRIASINLCPTGHNKANLLAENVKGDIYTTGNTGLDNIDKSGLCYGNKVLVTMHRRDNLNIMDKWFTVLSTLAKKYTDLEFIIPLHPNPNVQKHRHLLSSITVIDPLSHYDLIKLLKQCRFVISDSGGLQEEASYLNKKIIVCRRTTERPETVGVHSFMCSWPHQLEKIVDQIYTDYEVDAKCPYGDGCAWAKIKDILVRIQIT